MVRFLNQKHGGWVTYPGCTFGCERAHTRIHWCGIVNRTETLIETVDRMAEQKQDESPEIEGYLHLLREYFANVTMDMKEANVTCSESIKGRQNMAKHWNIFGHVHGVDTISPKAG